MNLSHRARSDLRRPGLHIFLHPLAREASVNRSFDIQLPPRGWKSFAKRETLAASLAAMAASKCLRTMALSCRSASVLGATKAVPPAGAPQRPHRGVVRARRQAVLGRAEARDLRGQAGSSCDSAPRAYFAACSKSSEPIAFIT